MVSIVAVLGLAFLLFLAGLEIDVHRLRGGRCCGSPCRVRRHAPRSDSRSAAGSTRLGWVRQPGADRGRPLGHLAGAGRSGAQGRRASSTARSARPWSRPPRWPTSPRSCSCPCSSRPASPGPAPASPCWSSSPRWSALTAVAALAVGRSIAALRDRDPAPGHHRRDPGPRGRAAPGRLRRAGRRSSGWRRSSARSWPAPSSGWSTRTPRTHPHFRTKLEALGYGFLIPVFFVSSGLRLDLAGLIDDPSALARVPVLAAALLVVRGVPALLLARRYDGRSVAGRGAAPGDLPAVPGHGQPDRRRDRDHERHHCRRPGLRRPRSRSSPTRRSRSGCSVTLRSLRTEHRSATDPSEPREALSVRGS